MNLRQLVEKADQGYVKIFPESSLLELVTAKGQPKAKMPKADTLAVFIVIELSETYDEEASDADQVETAADAMRKAVANLESVIDALEGEDGKPADRASGIVDQAIEGLTDYYGELRDKGNVAQIKPLVKVKDTGNDQADYDDARDQVERLVQDLLIDGRILRRE